MCAKQAAHQTLYL